MRTLLFAAACSLVLAAGAGAHPLRTAFPPSTTPMVSGEVVSATDHSVVLHTDENETMHFIVDSHSVVPELMTPGMRVSVEFRAMENGVFLAQRVVPLRPSENRNSQTTVNTSELDRERERYAMATPPSTVGELAMNDRGTEARYASNEGGGGTAAEERAENEQGEALPQTASNVPLIALLGLACLAAAGGMGLA